MYFSKTRFEPWSPATESQWATNELCKLISSVYTTLKRLHTHWLFTKKVVFLGLSYWTFVRKRYLSLWAKNFKSFLGLKSQNFSLLLNPERKSWLDTAHKVPSNKKIKLLLSHNYPAEPAVVAEWSNSPLLYVAVS